MARDRGGPLRSVWAVWATLDQPVDRRTYLSHGLGLALLKYAGDVLLVWLGAGRIWSPLDYLLSVASLLSSVLPFNAWINPWRSWLLPAMALWALPFMWLGVTLTLRRALDAGRSGWTALMFFVPFVNYLVMAWLSIAPSAPAPVLVASQASQRLWWRLPAAVLSVTAGVSVGIVAIVVSVILRGNYTVSLFLGAPFAMGAATAFVYNRRHDASSGRTAQVTALMILVVAGMAFLLASEGVVCIVMALPLALVVALFGAAVGRCISQAGQHSLPPAFFAVFALSASGLIEPASAGRLVHEVQSAIEIDAPPERVWPHVVAFRPIPEPSDLLFQTGIAYPKSARIVGEGVGAMRYCVFSTGAFVEPITSWEPARRLAFDVTASPPPLREWSLYEGLSPPHLDGYLRARRGEFRLVPLPDGRTRLEGSTWYELEMAPEGYWQIFSDYLIRRIHVRVLDHIKHEVES